MRISKWERKAMAIYTAVCLAMVAAIVIPNAKDHLSEAVEFCSLAILPGYVITMLIVIFTKPEHEITA